MSDLQGLIFDVDGTLADSEELHRTAFNRAFSSRGLDWRWSVDVYKRLLAVTGGEERIRHYIDDYAPVFDRPKDLSAYISGIHTAKTQHYVHMLENGQLPLRPGVQRLLVEARAGRMRLAIATTTSAENVQALLRSNLGESAMDWFEVIGAGSVVPAKKPAPDIYQYVLLKLDLKSHQCIAFEDSENGIRSACDAGLDTIITTNQYTQDHNFNGALLVVDSMGEPDRPFKVLQGNAGGATFLTMDLIKKLHQNKCL